MIGFGNLFGLQDIYEDEDGVRPQGVEDQIESSGSVEATVKNWQDQVDGVKDKRRTRVNKMVRKWSEGRGVSRRRSA